MDRRISNIREHTNPFVRPPVAEYDLIANRGLADRVRRIDDGLVGVRFPLVIGEVKRLFPGTVPNESRARYLQDLSKQRVVRTEYALVGYGPREALLSSMEQESARAALVLYEVVEGIDDEVAGDGYSSRPLGLVVDVAREALGSNPLRDQLQLPKDYRRKGNLPELVFIGNEEYKVNKLQMLLSEFPRFNEDEVRDLEGWDLNRIKLALNGDFSVRIPASFEQARDGAPESVIAFSHFLQRLLAELLKKEVVEEHATFTNNGLRAMLKTQGDLLISQKIPNLAELRARIAKQYGVKLGD